MEARTFELTQETGSAARKRHPECLIRNLVNEAALLATRPNAESVAMADFTSAVERIVVGMEKKNRLINPLERRVVAHHEMGHALVALSLPGSDPVHKISIIPRGDGALGNTIQRPTEDRFPR
jgi:cell division protease FtsH